MRSFYFYVFISTFISIISCQNSFKLSNDEYVKFGLEQNEVTYNSNPVAKIGNLEYEYTNGKFQIEVSLVQYSATYDEMTEKIARYVAMKYPKAKIEVKVLRDSQSDL